MKRVSALLFLFASLFLFVACPSPTGPESTGVKTTPKTCTVVSSSWYSSTFDSSYWPDSNSNPEAVHLTFEVTYKEDLVLADIDSIKATDPFKGEWGYNNAQISLNEVVILNEADKCISMNNLWVNSGSYEKKHCFGDWTIVITLTNGTTTKTTIRVTEPGFSTIHEGNTLLVIDSPRLHEVATLAKPAISAATLTSENISVTYSVKESRVRNAYICFYDVNNGYLGQTGFLLREKGEDGPLLKAENFNKEGLNTTVEISKEIADLKDFTQKQYDSIDNCIVIVTDGEQYAPSYWQYNHLRFSTRFTVTKKP